MHHATVAGNLRAGRVIGLVLVLLSDHGPLHHELADLAVGHEQLVGPLGKELVGDADEADGHARRHEAHAHALPAGEGGGVGQELVAGKARHRKDSVAP